MYSNYVSKNFTVCFDSLTTVKNPVNTGTEYQPDIGSPSNVDWSLCLSEVYQQIQRKNPASPSNQFNSAIFDTVNVRIYFVDFDSIRYAKYPVDNNYTESHFLDQYRDVKLFFQGYVGESILNPFISYLDLKTCYPIQINIWKFPINHILPMIIQFFVEYHEAPMNTILCNILMKQRDIKLVSDGNN